MPRLFFSSFCLLSAMPRLNHRNIAIIARFLGQVLRLLVRQDVSSSLAAFGGAQCLFMAFLVATSPSADRHGTIAGIAFIGVGTLWAAAWVAAHPVRRRATGRIILGVSLVLMFAIGLDDYEVFFDILREIA